MIAHVETPAVEKRVLAFDTDEHKQQWNSALVGTQLANPWVDWEIEPDPGDTLLTMTSEDTGLVPRKEDYPEIYQLAHEIATYVGADEYQEDEGDI
jgi:hypothetical protein